MNEGLISARVKYWPDRDYEIFDNGLIISFSRISDLKPLTVTNAPLNATYEKLYRGIDDLFINQPDVHASSGTNVTVKCELMYNTSVSYQWFYRNINDAYFHSISGATSATYTLTVSSSDDGMELVCAATQASNKTAYCKPITIHIV